MIVERGVPTPQFNHEDPNLEVSAAKMISAGRDASRSSDKEACDDEDDDDDDDNGHDPEGGHDEVTNNGNGGRPFVDELLMLY